MADLRVKRAWRRRRKARIALKLGSLKAEDQQEAVALVAGAWIVGLLPHHRTIRQLLKREPKLTVAMKPRDEAALLAHAYFRAGANLQQRAAPLSALRCYEAMPSVGKQVAPFAWVGSRLNAMMALKAEGRIEEAIAMATAVAGVAHEVLDDDGLCDRYGRAQLRDLRRRTVYLTAILRVDHLAEAPDDEDRQTPATAAVALLTNEIDNALDPEVHIDLALLTAMKMVRICHAVLDPGAGGPPADPATVLNASLAAAAASSPAPPLGSAAYYDAACAYTLMAPEGAPATDAAIKKAVAMLELAAAATPASSRARMLATAESDAMLAPLRQPSLRACFDKALGVIAAAEPDANLAVTVTQAEAAAA